MLWVIPYAIYSIGSTSGTATCSSFKLFASASGNSILSLFLFLKNSSLLVLEQLSDIYAKDFIAQKFRFIILYTLLSTVVNLRLFVQIKLTEFVFISSLSNIYLSAEWSERELWDMFGIFSLGNYDMRRLLTDYSFVGFPLRKTFPMTGFFEVLYDDFFQYITVERVSLRQAYRTFFYNKGGELATHQIFLASIYDDDFFPVSTVDEVFNFIYCTPLAPLEKASFRTKKFFA